MILNIKNSLLCEKIKMVHIKYDFLEKIFSRSYKR